MALVERKALDQDLTTVVRNKVFVKKISDFLEKGELDPETISQIKDKIAFIEPRILLVETDFGSQLVKLKQITPTSLPFLTRVCNFLPRQWVFLEAHIYPLNEKEVRSILDTGHILNDDLTISQCLVAFIEAVNSEVKASHTLPKIRREDGSYIEYDKYSAEYVETFQRLKA